MKILVTATHPTTRSDGSAIAPSDFAGWRIKWNGPGSAGAYYNEPMQPMSSIQTQTVALAGGENDTYTVAIEWYDLFGQKSIKALPTVTLHAPSLPAPPAVGDGSAVVIP